MKQNLENIIKKAKEVHGDKYDYSQIEEFKTMKTKYPIICPEHGVFWKSLEKHIHSKQGCPKCIGRFRYTTEYFIEKIKDLPQCHNCSFEKTKYVRNKDKIIITCHEKDGYGNEHGDFEISPGHLLGGEGCPKCRYVKSAKKKRRDISEVVNAAREVHGNKYDYSLITNYKNDRIKYPIICSEHGVFYQTFNRHIKGKQGCPKCGLIKNSLSRTMLKEEFIEKAKAVHGDKYDYSKVNYVKSDIKVDIICPKHGEFSQIPRNHLIGQGCPICSQSKLEEIVKQLLSENDIKYEREKKFVWLKYNGQMRLDFYLPEYKVAIECQGRQHFEPVDAWGGEKNLKEIKERDNEKLKLCKKHGLKVLYFSFDVIKRKNYFSDKESLLKEIKP